MRTKAYRRAKQASKTKRRIEMYAAIHWMGTDIRQEFRQNVLNGNYCKWLRTTGRPCSCSLCEKPNKYKRIRKDQLNKIALSSND